MPAGLRAISRRPALGLELGVVASWFLLAATMGGTGAAAAGADASSPWVCVLGMPGAGSGGAASVELPSPGALAAGLPMWGLMAVAMMLPAALPAVRHVGAKSLHRRRHRAMAEFTVVFVAVWAVFGVAVLAPLSARLPAGSALAGAGFLALAALWQLNPLKRRALRACHAGRTLPPRGWRASVGVARFGLLNGGACLGSCWAMMLTMAAAGPARLAWMAALTAATVTEKQSLTPLRTRRRIAALLAAAAVGTLAATALG